MDENNKTIAPCGAIANSLFSDQLILFKNSSNTSSVEIPLNRTGIAWEFDKKIKFKNPKGNLKEVFKNFSKPKDWRKPVYELDLEDERNNGFQNEDLIVWMRTAPLTTFRKLYRIIEGGLEAGNYTLKIKYCMFTITRFIINISQYYKFLIIFFDFSL